MKYNEKNAKNVFTKKESNDIIKKDYNPLKVNYKIYERGSGLFMEDEELNVAKKLSKKYNKKVIVVLNMINKCKMFGYDIKKCEKLVKEFEEKKCY